MIYLQALLDGVLLGGVYATIAVGLSLAFGVMGIINWAHGGFLMVSMFIAYSLCLFCGWDPYLAMFVCMIVLFIVGYFIQKFVFNPLLKKETAREPLSVLLSTAGLSMVLTNVATMIFGSYVLGVNTAYSGKTLWLGDIMVSVPKLISFVIAIAATLLLFLFLQKTEQGRALRATAQNRNVARLMGINVDRSYCLAFGISLGLVGIAGALLIPSFSVYPTVGDLYSNRAFIIVVLGGKGDIMGALAGGLIIGIIERIGAVLVSESFGVIMSFVLFIVMLLFKPTGLFTKKGSVIL